MPFSFKAASVAVDVTARYPIWELSADPLRPLTLIVRPAAEPNTAFLNAIFKMPDRGKRLLSVATMHATDAEAVEPYADHVIVGWENVVEDDGGRPEYTPAKGREFLAALNQPPPDGRPDLFRNLRIFCGNIENFRPAIVDGADLGKG
jgi:hypothetical protein